MIKAEIEVIFGGFDHGEWWLVVLGCREEPEAVGVGRKMPQNSGNTRGRLERERREKWVCAFAWFE